MSRKITIFTALVFALSMVPVLALGAPSITSISPAVTPANTGATVDILGSGFGSLTDRVYFPSNDGSFTTPLAIIPGGVRVRVPNTWSGNVRIQANGAGDLSNSVDHEITYSWSAHKWFTLPFTWHLNSSGAPGPTFSQTENALVMGYHTWNCASGSSTTYGGSTATATTANDGTNCLYWKNSGWSSGTIAVCTTFFYTSTGEIVEADIAFNSQHFSWAVDGDSGSMDVGHIGTHEEGHSLGLKDLYGAADVEKTMYGWSSDGDTHARTLRAEDAMGMEFIYPHSRANFTDVVRTGWSASLVARNSADASDTYCPLPTVLNGTGTTYMNASITNNGSDCASPSSLSRLFIDDVYRYWVTWSGVFNPGLEFSWKNIGLTVPGGRHTLGFHTDFNEEILETAEWDNYFSSQYVWAPYVLSHDVPLARVAPPVRGSGTYVNCDGFEFSTGGNWWAVVGTIPSNSSDDNDLRLHSTTPLANSGFDTYEASSAYGGDVVDYVLVNGNMAGGSNITRWAGLNRWSGGNGSAYVHMCQNLGTVNAPNTTSNFTLGGYDIVHMHEVYIPEVANWQFTMEHQSGTANLGFALYDKNGDYFQRSSNLAQGNAGVAGQDESFTFDIPEAGYYGVVVFKNNSADLSAAATYNLDFQKTPPNFTPFLATGWQYPVVVRNDNTAVNGDVQVSAVLDGNTNNTYFSVSGINDGPNPATAGPTRLYVDDVYRWYLDWGTINAGQEFKYYNLGTSTVRGGRHTVDWRIDWNDVIPESNEGDNNFSRQFIWSPRTLLEESPLTESPPPVRVGAGLYPNNVAFSLSPTSSFAWVTAVCATGAADDYDLLVYNNYTGPESGLTDLFQYSYQSSGYTDYVAGPYTTASLNRYPVVARWNGGVSNFVIDAASATGQAAGSTPATWLGKTLPSNHLVSVFEVYLVAGQTYAMEMINVSGGANLDVFAHAPSFSALSPASSQFQWTSQGSGSDEGGWFETAESGYHVFVVRKSGSGDIGLNATFNLNIFVAATGVAEEELALPDAFALGGAVPNPFNPATEIRYAVPAPGSRVRLDVFDLNGRLVRKLVDENRDAGRHSAFWDGLNDQGGRVASGTYFYRLQAGSFTDTKKMTLVK